MLARSFLVGLPLLGLLALPIEAAAKKGGQATSIDSDKLSSGTYTGTLVNTPGSDGSFTLQVKVQQPVLSGAGKGTSGKKVQQQLQKLIQQRRRQQQALIRRMQQAQRRNQGARRPGQPRRGNRGRNYRGRNNRNNAQQARRLAQQIQKQRQQVLRQLQGKGGGIKINTVTYNIDFQAAPDMVIRSLKPPQVFDDKGNLKTYTPEELRKLKGANPKLPGYDAELTNLEPGMLVQVTLGARARVRVPAEVAREAKRMQVKMIMIIGAGDPGAVPR
jgi:hypothetical protein